jgi:hypothetical protein
LLSRPGDFFQFFLSRRLILRARETRAKRRNLIASSHDRCNIKSRREIPHCPLAAAAREREKNSPNSASNYCNTFCVVCSARRRRGGGKGPERQRSKSLMLSRQTIKEILCCLPACFLLFPCHPPRPHLLVLCHNLSLWKNAPTLIWCGLFIPAAHAMRPRREKFVLVIIEKNLSSLFKKRCASFSLSAFYNIFCVLKFMDGSGRKIHI